MAAAAVICVLCAAERKLGGVQKHTDAGASLSLLCLSPVHSHVQHQTVPAARGREVWGGAQDHTRTAPFFDEKPRVRARTNGNAHTLSPNRRHPSPRVPLSTHKSTLPCLSHLLITMSVGWRRFSEKVCKEGRALRGPNINRQPTSTPPPHARHRRRFLVLLPRCIEEGSCCGWRTLFFGQEACGGAQPRDKDDGIAAGDARRPSIPPTPAPPPPCFHAPLTRLVTHTLLSHPQARQDLHLDFDPSFVPTPNARNTAMLREAADFAAALKRCEKDIRGVKNAAEGE